MPSLLGRQYTFTDSMSYDLLNTDTGVMLSPFSKGASYPSWSGSISCEPSRTAFAAVYEVNMGFNAYGDPAKGSDGYTGVAAGQTGSVLGKSAAVGWSPNVLYHTVTAGADENTGTPTPVGGKAGARAAVLMGVAATRPTPADQWKITVTVFSLADGATKKVAINRSTYTAPSIPTVTMQLSQMMTMFSSYSLAKTGFYREKPSITQVVKVQVDGVVTQGYTYDPEAVGALQARLQSVTSTDLASGLEDQVKLPNWDTYPPGSANSTSPATFGGGIWGQASGWFSGIDQWLWPIETLKAIVGTEQN